MHTKLKFDDIIYGNRLRQDYPEVEALAQSIHENGIIHPITIADADSPDGKVRRYELIAGGRRYHAYVALRNAHPGEYDEIPVTLKTIKSEMDLRLCELEENFRREDMTWQESTQGIAEFHRLSTIKANAAGERWTQQATGRLTGMSQTNVSFLLKVADALKKNDKEIWDCETFTDAVKALLDRQLKEANAERMRRVESQRTSQLNAIQSGSLAGNLIKAASGVATPPAQKSEARTVRGDDDSDIQFDPISFTDDGSVNEPLPADAVEKASAVFTHKEKPQVKFPPEYIRSFYLSGDCVEVMKKMKSDGVRIDHIITDPPYGIDMGNLDQISGIETVEATHGVQDNLNMFGPFLNAAYDLLPDHGFLAMWYDLDHHEKLMDLGRKAGFKVQRWPIVWCKTSPCINSTAQFNFTKSTEVCMVFRKTSHSILATKQGNNFILEPNTKEVDHPFAKPFPVWERLITALSLEGQTIFDPFAGSGSLLYAAFKTNRVPLGCEIDENHIANGVDWLCKKLNKNSINDLL